MLLDCIKKKLNNVIVSMMSKIFNKKFCGGFSSGFDLTTRGGTSGFIGKIFGIEFGMTIASPSVIQLDLQAQGSLVLSHIIIHFLTASSTVFPSLIS